MADVTWVRIRSWHAASGLVSRAGGIKARCGRWVDPGNETSDTLPAGKSCETCLRLVARDNDGA